MKKQKIRSCCFCGCTDEVGCADGCWWIADNVCSECQEEWNKKLNDCK